MAARVNKNYRRLRSRLIERGFTIRSWAARYSYPLTTVYDAVKGNRRGIAARRIKKELEEFANG